MSGPEVCGICGEALHGEVGEFFDPADPDADSVVAHAGCALAAGMDLA